MSLIASMLAAAILANPAHAEPSTWMVSDMSSTATGEVTVFANLTTSSWDGSAQHFNLAMLEDETVRVNPVDWMNDLGSSWTSAMYFTVATTPAPAQDVTVAFQDGATTTVYLPDTSSLDHGAVFLVDFEDDPSHDNVAYLMWGPVEGSTNLSSADIVFAGQTDWVNNGGRSTGAGDVDAAGYDDILIGAADNDSTIGSAYLFLAGSWFYTWEGPLRPRRGNAPGWGAGDALGPAPAGGPARTFDRGLEPNPRLTARSRHSGLPDGPGSPLRLRIAPDGPS